jgi:lysophospholipid acyltransferase (LPLAT)-like uncharacterized protein
MFRSYILPRLIYFIYRLYSLTWRVRLIEPPDLQTAVQNGEPLVFAHWHRDELAIVQFVSHYRIATMTSTSKDGQLIDYVIKKLGGNTSKGSSTRGGSSALLGLTRLIEEGYRGSIAVDGPKGPIFQAKPGVFELSRLSKAWIVPTGVACSSKFVFEKSWNKARLPKPFSKVVVTFGKMTRLGEEDPRHPALAFELGQEINRACEQAEQKL